MPAHLILSLNKILSAINVFEKVFQYGIPQHQELLSTLFPCQISKVIFSYHLLQTSVTTTLY